MAFVSGPRQVGKTTVCRNLGDAYLNWDDPGDRRVLLKGPGALAERLDLQHLRVEPPVVVLDELHKHGKWKGLLKGFFDVHGQEARVLVTGSARLEVFKRGGDSLMGRYLPYRMHPFSVAECLRTAVPGQEISSPMPIANEDWEALWTHGGFPEPFLKRDLRFTRRWRALRHEQMAREDLRDLTRVQELGALDSFMRLLEVRSGQQLVYSNLAGELGVAVDTIRRWLDLLERLYVGFRVRPWSRNVARSLRKEPKWYSRDWSGLADEGARAETLVACHLLKAVEGWTDLGFGAYELFYLRDKEKREVDFLVARDGQPWILVEAKAGETALSPALRYFQIQTGAPHAFQVVVHMPYEPVDCFKAQRPVTIGARTLLSQLL